MEKKLGRGLGALIPEDVSKPKEKVDQIRLSDIVPNRFQPRQVFSREQMEELIASIKEKGVIQPVLVRPRVDGKYELIAGERRWRAANELKLEEIPALIRRDTSDVSSLEISIIENIQREGLNPIEEANAYRKLMEVFEYTLDRVGQMVGRDKTTISNSLRLLKLPEEIQRYIQEGQIASGHAKVLLSVLNEYRQKKFAHLVIKNGLSVRQLEQLAKIDGETKKKASKQKDPEVARIESELQHKLGTKVQLKHGKKRGYIEIQYYSLDDLQRILNILTR